MRSIALIFLVIVSITGVTGIEAALPIHEELAIVVKRRGLVMVHYEDSLNPVLVTAGYIINRNATITTGRNAFVLVRYLSSPTTMIVRPESRITISTIEQGNVWTKSIHVHGGELLCDVVEMDHRSFDIFTAANLISLGKSTTLIGTTHDMPVTTIFTLSGTGSIADVEFSSWLELPPLSVGFATGGGLVFVDSLDRSSTDSIRAIVSATRSFQNTAMPFYQLELQARPGGSITPQGQLITLGGVGIDIKAQADSGYTFTGWKVIKGAANVANPADDSTTLRLSSSTVVEASFSRNPYGLIIDRIGNGYTIPAGTTWVDPGNLFSIQVITRRGHDFAGWKKKGDLTFQRYGASQYLVNLTTPRATARAVFQPKSYKLTVSHEGEGNAQTDASQGEVEHGSHALLSAVAAPGNWFTHWEVVQGHAAIANPREPETTVMLDSTDAEIKAVFSNEAVKIALQQHDSVSMTPQGVFFVPKNSRLAIHAEPTPSLSVTGWNISDGRARIEGTERATVVCRSSFKAQPTIATTLFSLDITHNGKGSVTPIGSHRAFYGQSLTLSATPDKGQFFARWSITGGTARLSDPQSPTTEIILTEGNAAVQAEFTPEICTLIVDASPGGRPEPGGTIKSFALGETMVKALPNPNAVFVGWEVVKGKDNIKFSDSLNIADQIITSITGHATIKAVFSTDPADLTILSNGLGSTVPAKKIRIARDRWIPLAATPFGEQKFSQWLLVSGDDVEIKDAYEPTTEIKLGGTMAIIKALFLPETQIGLAIQGAAAADSGLAADQVDLRIRNREHGSVNRDSSMAILPNMPIFLGAIPEPGYRFYEWRVLSGDIAISDQSNPKTIVTIKSGRAEIMPVFIPRAIHVLEVIMGDWEGRTKTISATYR